MLGIQPRWAETGYGYIEFPKNVRPGETTAFVASFAKARTSRTARSFVERGNFFWNAGMFFWRASTVLDLMRHHQPKTARCWPACRLSKSKAVYGATGRGLSALRQHFGRLRNYRKSSGKWPVSRSTISAGTMSGSWEAVYDLAKKDADGNASRGDLVVEGAGATTWMRVRRWRWWASKI